MLLEEEGHWEVVMGFEELLLLLTGCTVQHTEMGKLQETVVVTSQ